MIKNKIALISKVLACFILVNYNLLSNANSDKKENTIIIENKIDSSYGVLTPSRSGDGSVAPEPPSTLGLKSEVFNKNKNDEKKENYILVDSLIIKGINKLKLAKVNNKSIDKALFWFSLANIILEKEEDEIVLEFWKTLNIGYIKTNTSWERQRNILINLKKDILENNIFDNLEEQELFYEINKKINFLSFLGLTKIGKNKIFIQEKLDLIKKIILSDNYNENIFDYLINFEKKKEEEKLEKIKKEEEIKLEKIKKEEEKKLLELQKKEADKKKAELILIENNLNNKELISSKNITKEDLLIAKTAWKYFEKSYKEKTGFFDSALYYDKTTMWDVGSSLAGIISAHKLNIIDKQKADFYLNGVLNALDKIKKYNNELPNREYNTSSGNMTSGGVISKTGDGWSALDIGRLLIWLKITENWYPQHKEKIKKIFNSWNFKRLTKDNKMHGLILENKETLRQEGRLGYEQYSASGFYKWNISIPNALDYDKTKKVKIWDIEISVDNRNLAYLTSEPFFLAKIELGKVDNNFDYMLNQLYLLQKKRFEKYNKLTAISEDSLDKFPWFIYNSFYFNNKAWVCTSPSGKEYPDLKTLSTKASIAFYSIFNDDYSNKLKDKIKNNFNNFGFYSGIYEKTDEINKSTNINTNAVILESILYKKLGKSFID
ncbi:MAG: DUF3131 domain-containing protein [Candidatus Sericytochromatia bacterium]